MILNDKDAISRLNSPMNLVNKLGEKKTERTSGERKNAMSLFIPSNNKPYERPPVAEKPEVVIEIPPAATTVNKIFINPFDSATINSDSSRDSHSQRDSDSSSQRDIQSAKLDTILENPDTKIKLGLAHDKAIDLLARSIEVLSDRLNEVSPAKLPTVILAASKTVEGIRRERNENLRNNKDREVHYHFYTPQQRKVEDFEVIDA